MDERINAGVLQASVTAIFIRCGMGEADAALLAETLVESDLRGVHSHGVMRVADYAAKLTTGGVDPRGRPRVTRDSGACLVVDGGNSMGQIGTQFGMQQAIERAATLGLAAVAIGGSNHCGALAYFAMQALPRGMIGFATTNALPTMAYWGSSERLLGINPVAFAIPAAEERPLVYDAAFSASAHGKIRILMQKGLPIPEGWAMDHEGRPTTDAAVALAAGLLAPIGSFKGTGLAMIAGILAAMLSGARYGTELGSLEEGPAPGEDGHFVGALRIDAFTDPATFKTRVDSAIRQARGGRLAPGFDRVYLPGEREFLTRDEYLKDGIPLNAVTLADLRRTAGEYGVSLA
jgi:LDH2 family malate/lactate/ureidoglycolate dehydrogenase